MITENDLGADDYILTKDNRIAIVNNIHKDSALVEFYDDGSEKEIAYSDIAQVLPGNRSLELGDRVKLESVFYPEPSDENPYDCHGTVTDFDGYWFYVDWDNGKWNTYRALDADLTKVKAE